MISVIVPVYRVEKYIHRCIDSIVVQIYNDFELILVDDGSSDKCGKICDEYAKMFSRINVIHKVNGGLSSARNAGLDIANGEYVVFVDSDDYIDTNLLQKGTEQLNQTPGALISYGFYIEDELGNIKSETRILLPETIFLNTELDRASFICNELTDYREPWTVWSKFYSRDIIENNHIRFADNRLIFAEDLYFNLCYFSFVEKIINIYKPLYHYMERTDSIMGVDVSKNNTKRFEKLTEAVYLFYLSNEKAKYMLKFFSLVYYKVINHSVECDLRMHSQKSYLESSEIIGEIKDKKKFYKNLKSAWKKRSYLNNDYLPKHYNEEKISMLLYSYDRRNLCYKLRNKLIFQN